MQTNFTLLFILLIFPAFLVAQHKVVAFDYEKTSFNNNQPLPAGTHLLVQGDVPASVDLVEFEVFDAKGREFRKPLHSATWKRPFGKDVSRFDVPVNYKLKGGSTYDFKISFYASIGDSDKRTLQEQILEQLNTYLDQNLGIQKNSIKLVSNSQQMMNDMNQIMNDNMKHYRTKIDIGFEGFTQLIENTLKNIQKTNLKKAKHVLTEENTKEAKASYRNKLINDLKKQVKGEVQRYLDTELLHLVDSRYINDYATEKTRRILAVQGGYGGAYLSGGFQNVEIGSAPYLGLAFPLGKSTFAPKFWSNTSITIGAFLTDFKGLGTNGGDVSGPIFKRPTSIGLSYKVYQFIHLNAGATFLEDASTAGQLNGLEKRVFIRPNLGLSLQINLWADLSR